MTLIIFARMRKNYEADGKGWAKGAQLKSLIWSVTGMNVISGTISGAAGVLAGHPFDTVKVRLQTQDRTTKPTMQFRNTWHCFTSITKEEGIRGLFRGVTSPLAGVTIINTFLFGVYGFFLDLQTRGTNNSDESATLAQIFIAGSSSGLINSVISCPVELAKIQLQNQGLDRFHTNPHFKSPTQCLYHIFRNGGVMGLYRGFLATVIRETPSYGVYFASFEWLRRSFETEDASIGNLKLMLAGGLSGIAAWISTYPMDVIKTRLQAQSWPIEKTRYATPASTSMTIRKCYRNILKNEGISGLFKGITATLVRAFPTNAVIFTTYALTKRWLEECGPNSTSSDHSPEPGIA